MLPRDIRVSRSLRKTLRQGRFRITVDTAFDRVIRECAAPRRDGDGTWITPDMIAAYQRMHSLGYAHSVECWHEGELAGGLYGVSLGRVFFGESMFSRVSDASKVALVYLREMDFEVIDCQVPSGHLARLGARNLSREAFLELLDKWCDVSGRENSEQMAEGSA